MAYCNATDVGNQVGFTYSIGSTPTLAVVGDFINATTAEINAVLRAHGFEVTATTDLPTNDSYLRELCAIGAAYKAARVQFSGQAWNASPVVAELRDEYQRKLARLEANPALVLNTSDMAVVRFAGFPNAVQPPEQPDFRYKIEDEY